MINHSIKLTKDILEAGAQIPMAATRDGFGKALMELGETNKKVVVVCADLAESTRVIEFQEKYPERYIEAGVAEQNMATVASGLANYGKIPFIASYAAFSPGRNNEQIRTTISLNNLPVKIAGMHAGVSVGPDGATHQALEDIALMRVQPHMTVIVPCDSEEARKATIAAAEIPGPVYLRFGREKSPTMTTTATPFVVGKVQVLWKGKKPKVAVFASGALLYHALLAAQKLADTIETIVVNVHTVKPLDPNVVKIAKSAGAVVTVEEHQIAGGVGSAIAEMLAAKYPVPIEFIGVKDRFGQSGEPSELFEHYGMGVSHIVAAIKKVHARKI
jgi:transketolase